VIYLLLIESISRTSSLFVKQLTSPFSFRHNLLVPYLKQSKLQRRPINLDGVRSQIMFTQWCWNSLTLSFFLSGIVTLQSAYNDAHDSNDVIISPFIHQIILRCAILSFEIAGPTSMLVSTVTKYALWPQSLKSPRGSGNLRKPVALIQHNANIIASLLEVGVLGRIAVRWEDVVIAPAYGCIYVLFMWSLKDHLVESKEPQFIYFFFDTTLGRTWSISVLLGLLAILLVFYSVFTLVDDILLWMGGGIVTNAVMVGTFASIFCRFKD